MPNKPKKVVRSWVPQRTAFDRNANSNQEFYNSRTWRNFAKRFKEKNPLCVECLKDELIVPVKVVDHIVAINAGGDKLSESNCQSLCESCHNRKSANESRGYGVKSR